MANIIDRIFAKKPDPRIQALADAVVANKADEDWLGSFHARAIAQQKEAESLLEAFTANPSDEAAKDFLKAHTAALTQEEGLVKLSSRGQPAIQEKILARTRPALRSALEAAVERLSEELSEVRRRDSEAAKDLGLAASDTESPIQRKLESEISRAENFLRGVDGFTIHQLSAPIQFVLARS